MFILFCNFFSTFVIFLLHAPCGNQLRLTGSAWVNKVLYLSIRSELIDSPSSPPTTETSTSSITPFDKFKVINEEDVNHLITKSGKKSCALDPMPTSFVIECTCLGVLRSDITRLINLSLDSGLFSDDWKHAEVRPGVKNNSSFDPPFSNLRPISNLTFIAKLKE